MRVEFDRQLESLNRHLIAIAELCAESVTKSTAALLEKNEEYAQDAISNEKKIDSLASIIERQAIRVILTEQPVASDLRFVSAALKMNTDLERIGDQAEDVGHLVGQMIRTGYRRRELGSLKEMSVLVAQMTQDAVKAFVDGDSALAADTIKMDDEVDQLFDIVRDEIIEEIRDVESHEPINMIDLLMIAKYLERIGDHAENIAEAVLYSLTGSTELQD